MRDVFALIFLGIIIGGSLLFIYKMDLAEKISQTYQDIKCKIMGNYVEENYHEDEFDLIQTDAHRIFHWEILETDFDDLGKFQYQIYKINDENTEKEYYLTIASEKFFEMSDYRSQYVFLCEYETPNSIFIDGFYANGKELNYIKTKWDSYSTDFDGNYITFDRNTGNLYIPLITKEGEMTGAKIIYEWKNNRFEWVKNKAIEIEEQIPDYKSDDNVYYDYYDERESDFSFEEGYRRMLYLLKNNKDIDSELGCQNYISDDEQKLKIYRVWQNCYYDNCNGYYNIVKYQENVIGAIKFSNYDSENFDENFDFSDADSIWILNIKNIPHFFVIGSKYDNNILNKRISVFSLNNNKIVPAEIFAPNKYEKTNEINTRFNCSSEYCYKEDFDITFDKKTQTIYVPKIVIKNGNDVFNQEYLKYQLKDNLFEYIGIGKRSWGYIYE